MKPCHVAIFTEGMSIGPFRIIAACLARGFKEMGISCDVVVLKATDDERAQFPDLNIISLDSRRAIFSLPGLVAYLRKMTPDVLFSMPWYFNVIAIWAKLFSRTNTKVVMGEHNIISLEAKIEHGHVPRLKYMPVFMRWTYPFGDGIIGVAVDVIEDLIVNVKVSRRIPMTVIPNPADLPRTLQRAAEHANLPVFADPTAPLILTVARFARQKNLDVLLRAVAEVRKTRSANLLIIGEGVLRPQLEELVGELGLIACVAMPGIDHNPIRYMAICDVFALVSEWEGCPVALQEALTVGAAVVVSDAPGGCREMVNNGDCGIVVPTGDPSALAAAIRSLLSDEALKREYQRKAKIRANDFRYDVVSEKYIAFAASLP